jgi:hypothetical protein
MGKVPDRRAHRRRAEFKGAALWFPGDFAEGVGAAPVAVIRIAVIHQSVQQQISPGY